MKSKMFLSSFFNPLTIIMTNVLLLSNLTGAAKAQPFCSRCQSWRRPCSALDLRGTWNIDRCHRGDALRRMSGIIRMTPVRRSSLLKRQQRRQKYSSSPRYDISEDDEKMELSFDLPGVSAENVSLEIQEEGKVLKMSGSREYKQNGETIKSEFGQMFAIDPTSLNIEHISANLSAGVLTLSAPKLKQAVPTKKGAFPIKFKKNSVQSEEVKISSEQNGEE